MHHWLWIAGVMLQAQRVTLSYSHFVLKLITCMPLKITEEVPKDGILDIHVRYFPGKPMCCMTWIMIVCSTVSKAFAKSSFKMIISRLIWWHWWIYWKLQARQSWIVLLLIKLYWLSCSTQNIFRWLKMGHDWMVVPNVIEMSFLLYILLIHTR
jgi:hypothetical protein